MYRKLKKIINYIKQYSKIKHQTKTLYQREYQKRKSFLPHDWK